MDTLENKNIKNKTDTIGFLFIIINIPKTIDINTIKYKYTYVYPFVCVSDIKYKEPIFILNNLI